MTKEVAAKIVRGITDKIECNTIDIDDWAEFWGFTKEEYEEFLDMAIKGMKELQAHREAWEKVLDEMKDVSIPGQDAEYVYQNIYDIIRKYRPKEGENE